MTEPSTPDEVPAGSNFKAQGEQLWRLQGKERPWEEARAYQDVCQCTVCGEIFSTASNFERHRARNIAVDERRAADEGRYVCERWCLSDLAIEARGLEPKLVRGVCLWRVPPPDRPFYVGQEALLDELDLEVAHG